MFDTVSGRLRFEDGGPLSEGEDAERGQKRERKCELLPRPDAVLTADNAKSQVVDLPQTVTYLNISASSATVAFTTISLAPGTSAVGRP